MRVHFIAIGGSAMHNLAIALHQKGYYVTGSDDEIFEPSRSRLDRLGLLPEKTGWYPEKIDGGIDAVILGMHAKADNPELQKARETGLPVFSYPEYLYEQSKQKKRIVIGGSHGKTTITAMILHVMHTLGLDADYMVGAQLEGFDVMVRLTESAPVMVLEGDEYLSSTLDPRPKFHIYRPNIALLSGIAWDHINVFPTFENYVQQFRIFLEQIEPGGCLMYCMEDEHVAGIVAEREWPFRAVGYGIPDYIIKDDGAIIVHEGTEYPVKIFGRHNMMNLNGARKICNELGVSDEDYFGAISRFGGASRRLQAIADKGSVTVFKDFAHSPSKLKATVDAVRERYPGRTLIACMELHTYSSLSKDFLREYSGTMDGADIPVVFFDPHAISLKRLPPVTNNEIIQSFGHPGLALFSDPDSLRGFLAAAVRENSVLLLMSSGNFGGLDPDELAGEIIKKTGI